jgi:dTDP-4-dehydrorhamnose reductase
VGLETQLLKPDILFNCAAYTAVDKAEKGQDLVILLLIICCCCFYSYAHANDVSFIHISTDYVFHGSQDDLDRDELLPQLMYMGILN